MTRGFDWNDEIMVHIEALLRNGDSASQIEKQLGGGVSRNAVIGKIHRTKHLSEIGLGGNGTKSEKCALATKRRHKRADKTPVVKQVKQKLHPGNIVRKKASRAIEKPLAIPMPTISSLAYEQDCLRLLIHDLGPRQCRWEVNNAPLGEDHLFCGKEADEGSSWCTHHARRAHGPGTESERSATRMAIHLGRAA